MGSACVFDIEANAKEAENVTKVWCIVIYDLQTEEVFKYGPDDIERGVDKLRSYHRVCGHNIIGYDIPVLNLLYRFSPSSLPIDTLILSRLADPDRGMPWGMKGQPRPHSIEAWGWRFAKPKVEWNKWDEWDPEMLVRCEKDVLINVEVYKALYKEFEI